MLPWGGQPGCVVFVDVRMLQVFVLRRVFMHVFNFLFAVFFFQFSPPSIFLAYLGGMLSSRPFPSAVW